MLATSVLRPALAPAVPLHVATAPAGGTGKSYLADLAAMIATGERCPVLTAAAREEETEKRLHAAALSGQPVIALDNCNGTLRSEFLCQVVERPRVQVRPLGTSNTVTIVNAFTLFANGNNVEVAFDLVRRTLLCTLDADMERPETRSFKADPLAAVATDRGKYVAAILTIARAYFVAGMPGAPPVLMSFPQWSNIVRGSLMWLGMADPVETMADLSAIDPVREIRAAVFSGLATLQNNGRGYTAAELVEKANEMHLLELKYSELREALLLPEVAGVPGNSISTRRLGKWLKKSKDQICDGRKLTMDASDQRRVRWNLRPV
jgi:putative DNA primase/helicase